MADRYISRAALTMPDFVCPDCGVVIKNNKSANRKRCPRCAYLAQKERQNPGGDVDA